ncbi:MULTISPECIES: cold shock domain-containing protein [unclassified Nostoc]|uniref:cold shock domain-containing protein n=1 Tax=unclassified Nostoc TaxID=2593658 RepID=UPI00263762A1|nr:cold shock domain-containing protein [Nostoc sp. S13]MDF5734128.1 cold shock domain-containing protein [Nostoc sp. S13]
MKITGTIRGLSIKQGKVSCGFITPDTPIPGHEGNILFFADKLIGVAIEDLERGNLVEFSVKEWNRKDGTVEKIADEVCLLNEYTRLTGVINWLNQQEGRGFIRPDITLKNQEKDLLFFKRDLEEITIENLFKGDKVEFILQNINYQDGRIIKAVKKIRLVVSSLPKPTESLNNKAIFNIDTSNVKDIKENISYCLGNCMKLSDSAEFEDYVFMVFRLLGIHNLYQYDKKNQAGRADGFFIIGSLAVMYDCTLRKNFDEHKKEQIENYVNKLKNSQMTIDVRLTDGGGRKKTLQIQGKNRQVWIITQENTRELYDVDGIRIKEISVQDLIKIFNKRLYSDAFEEDELSAHLAVIDKT